MRKSRLEAFSDGVIAIILTIMVLELRAPHGAALGDLVPLVPKFLSYILSFVYVGIYWNNHHHLMHAVDEVTGSVLWANLHLLFWLSLIPFTTAWVGETGPQPWPVAVYGAVLLLAGTAYYFLVHALIDHHGKHSDIAKAIGDDFKGKVSLAVYASAVGLAFASPALALALYAVVAVMWVSPDPRIERILRAAGRATPR